MADRAQTTFDFAVGITLFLLVVAFAFTTVPGFLAPYEGGGESAALLADRAANQLATSNLTDDERYAVNATKAEAFFANLDTAKSTLGVDGDRYGLNVTLLDSNGNCPDGVSTCRFADATLSSSTTVSRSRRVVTVGGEQADLTVRVWSE